MLKTFLRNVLGLNDIDLHECVEKCDTILFKRELCARLFDKEELLIPIRSTYTNLKSAI